MILNAVATLQITPSLMGDGPRAWLEILRGQLNGIQLQMLSWNGKMIAVDVSVQPASYKGLAIGDFWNKYGFNVLLQAKRELSNEDLSTSVTTKEKNTGREEVLTFTIDEVVEGCRSEFAHDLVRVVSDISLAAFLAAPDSFDVRDCTVWVNDEVETTTGPDRLTFHAGLVDHGRQFGGWPQLANIPFVDVLNWLKAIDGFAIGIPAGPSGRAVSALTHVLMDSGLKLVWAVLGLEAIYCRGGKDLAHQLRQKSSALLGEPKEYKKRIQEMYEHRSELVHGSLNVPMAYEWLEALEPFEKIQEREIQSTQFATTLLVSTIQQLILRGGHSIESDFTVRVV